MRRYWKTFLIVIITISLIGVVYIYNQKEKEVQRVQLRSDLATELAPNFRETAKIVDLSAIAPFPWDRVYFFDPYTSSRKIDSVLGRFWLESRFTNIESSDRITLIVFIHNGWVAQYLEFPRGQGDFSNLDNDVGYIREEAIFSIDAKGDIYWLSP